MRYNNERINFFCRFSLSIAGLKLRPAARDKIATFAILGSEFQRGGRYPETDKDHPLFWKTNNFCSFFVLLLVFGRKTQKYWVDWRYDNFLGMLSTKTTPGCYLKRDRHQFNSVLKLIYSWFNLSACKQIILFFVQEKASTYFIKRFFGIERLKNL